MFTTQPCLNASTSMPSCCLGGGATRTVRSFNTQRPPAPPCPAPPMTPRRSCHVPCVQSKGFRAAKWHPKDNHMQKYRAMALFYMHFFLQNCTWTDNLFANFFLGYTGTCNYDKQVHLYRTFQSQVASK